MKRALILAAVAAVVLAGPVSAQSEDYGDYPWLEQHFQDRANLAVGAQFQFVTDWSFVQAYQTWWDGEELKEGLTGNWVNLKPGYGDGLNEDGTVNKSAWWATYDDWYVPSRVNDGKYLSQGNMGLPRNMIAGEALRFDLGDVYDLSQVMVLFDRTGGGHGGWDAYVASSFIVEVSMNGEDWERVNFDAPAYQTTGTCTDGPNCLWSSMGMWYDIEATAQFVRITDVVGANGGNWRFSEILILEAPEVPAPEPATMSLLALGGLALLRRRRG